MVQTVWINIEGISGPSRGEKYDGLKVGMWHESYIAFSSSCLGVPGESTKKGGELWAY